VSLRLLLVGAGHAHRHVLRAMRREPPPGARIVLLAPYPRQIYSGMLPGWIAGHYALAQCEVALAPLLRGGPVNVVAAGLQRLDLETRSAYTDRGHRIDFDLISVDTGSVTDTDGLPGLHAHGLPVRPIERFVEGWQRLIAVFEAAARSQAPGGGDPPSLTVIGGGAGGLELALAAAWRAQRGPAMRVQLVSGKAGLLPSFPPRVRALAQARVRALGVRLIEDDAVELGPDSVLLADGGELKSDAALVAIGAAAARWPRAAGLQTDAHGFIEVDATLRSPSHPFLFAAGDCASMVGQRQPKSGVEAVRAGPPLAANLRLALAGGRLRRYRPRQRALSLLATGNRHAIASWGGWSLQGAWVWRWKDRIDRGYLRGFDTDAPQ